MFLLGTHISPSVVFDSNHFNMRMNCKTGQTCVAPDYVLVDKSRKEELVRLILSRSIVTSIRIILITVSSSLGNVTLQTMINLLR